MDIDAILLAGLIFAAALLYAAVGHGGASGYLAAMALFGIAPATMKPTALALNVLVASIGTYRFARAGHFDRRLFLPLVLCSAPAAFIGGYWQLPAVFYAPLLGVVLAYTALWMWRGAPTSHQERIHTPPTLPLLISGAGIGLLSGLTGVGGGIFLSPLMIMLAWAPTRTVSAIAAPFILVNSIAGLIGLSSAGISWPQSLPLWALLALVGGLIGAEYGSRYLSTPYIRRALALVLVVAALKMIARSFS
ncbi:MAG: sulfite exporter TauE/SafE family protein [Gammaproteobacteria bacterium]|nr:sulfite exporter TauE/SafE family protein [Gammaproteobacteria bacterium]